MQRERDTEAVEQARRRIDVEYDYRKRKDEEREKLLDATIRRRSRQETGEALARPVGVAMRTARDVAGLSGGGLVQSAAGAAGMVPYIGPALSQAVTGLRSVVDALGSTAERLRSYGPASAVAGAESDVAQILGDLRRAEFLDKEMSDFIRSKSELSQNAQDALAEILKPLLPIITDALKGLSKFIDWAMKTVPNAAVDVVNTFIDLLNGVIQGLNEVAKFVSFGNATRIKELDHLKHINSQTRALEQSKDPGHDADALLAQFLGNSGASGSFLQRGQFIPNVGAAGGIANEQVPANPFGGL